MTTKPILVSLVLLTLSERIISVHIWGQSHIHSYQRRRALPMTTDKTRTSRHWTNMRESPRVDHLYEKRRQKLVNSTSATVCNACRSEQGALAAWRSIAYHSSACPISYYLNRFLQHGRFNVALSVICKRLNVLLIEIENWKARVKEDSPRSIYLSSVWLTTYYRAGILRDACISSKRGTNDQKTGAIYASYTRHTRFPTTCLQYSSLQEFA